MKRKDPVLEKHKEMTTIEEFLASYNKIAPEGFERATISALRKFQAVYPSLFTSKKGYVSTAKNPKNWSVEIHRKKLMDWLPSYRDA